MADSGVSLLEFLPFYFTYLDERDKFGNDRILHIPVNPELILAQLEKMAQKYPTGSGSDLFTTKITHTKTKNYERFVLTVTQNDELFSFYCRVLTRYDPETLTDKIISDFGLYIDFVDSINSENPTLAFKMLEDNPTIVTAFFNLPKNVKDAAYEICRVSQEFDHQQKLTINDIVMQGLSHIDKVKRSKPKPKH